ncbi:Uncharacterized protein Rs2_37549 [Raphanus sativus]|nr:Uncharacterized protein Rs2_37549 [Raphanus sativus]
MDKKTLYDVLGGMASNPQGMAGQCLSNCQITVSLAYKKYTKGEHQQNKENGTTSRSKLKKRLTKIHKKKTSLGKIAFRKGYGGPVAAKLLGTNRKERKRKDISLAYLSQAANNQRGNGFPSR